MSVSGTYILFLKYIHMMVFVRIRHFTGQRFRVATRFHYFPEAFGSNLKAAELMQ